MNTVTNSVAKQKTNHLPKCSIFFVSYNQSINHSPLKSINVNPQKFLQCVNGTLPYTWLSWVSITLLPPSSCFLPPWCFLFSTCLSSSPEQTRKFSRVRLLRNSGQINAIHHISGREKEREKKGEALHTVTQADYVSFFQLWMQCVKAQLVTHEILLLPLPANHNYRPEVKCAQ